MSPYAVVVLILAGCQIISCAFLICTVRTAKELCAAAQDAADRAEKAAAALENRLIEESP